MDKESLNVKTGRSLNSDEKEAVRELHASIWQPDAKVVFFFCSSRYNLEVLGKELDAAFDCPLIGCTTSGELSSKGYQEGGIVGASVASDQIDLYCNTFSPLTSFSLSEATKSASDTFSVLSAGPVEARDDMFGFILIDGLSMFEDYVIANLGTCFKGIPIIGGSAGDDLDFHKTYIYDQGKFISDAAVFAVFKTSLPFSTFRIQHFKPTEIKLVITGAEPKTRTITEINGEPAAVEYARILDMDTQDLNSRVFSRNPFMLKIGGEWYVRSIQKNNDDHSLSMFSAIEEGLVLTIGNGVDLTRNLEKQIALLEQEVPDKHFYLLCDCILRKQELIDFDLIEDANKLLRSIKTVGFSTYGEQFNSVHFNQTLTGIVIGEKTRHS